MSELRVEVTTNPESELWAAGERCEYDVFHKAGFSTSQRQHDRNYDPYTDNSVFGLVLDEEDVVHGCTRLLISSSEAISWERERRRFKAIKDTMCGSPEWGSLQISRRGWRLLRQDFDPRRTIEVATTAVPGEFRATEVSHILPSIQAAAAILLGDLRPSKPDNPDAPPAIIASLYDLYLRSLLRTFGLTIREIGQFRDYGGGPTKNVIIDVPELVAFDGNRSLGGRGVIDLSRLTEDHKQIIAKRIGEL